MMKTGLRNSKRRLNAQTNNNNFCIVFMVFLVGAWAGWTFSLSLLLERGTQRSSEGYTATPTSVLEELTTSLTSKRLNKIAQELTNEYRNAYPFPHVVIDDLFPSSVLNALLEELPESLVGSNGCYSKHHQCNKATPTSYQYHKSAINKEEEMGLVTREVLLFLISSNVFLEFLKQLTGMRGLLGDPQLNGGGVHLTAPGGKLDLHADFNAYAGPKLDRRVNFFLFLNPNWQDEYGGHLELWNRDLTKCGQRISPSLGTVVIFSTSDFSYHGHPNPLTAPSGRVRRSIALYYYTVGRPKEECLNEECPVYADDQGNKAKHTHGTLWKQPAGCTDCLDPDCNALPKF